MAEELQSLLDKIQKDGVQKAEAEAGKIIDEAKKKAEQIVAEAQEQAQKATEQAQKDARSFEQRANKSLEQAARDVVLSVERAVQESMQKIVNEDVSEAMSTDTLQKLIVAAVGEYCKSGSASDIGLLVSEADKKKLMSFLTSNFAAKIKNGMTIEADDSIISGFKVSLKDKNIQHDFTGTAVSEAICQLVRPRLAEIMRKSQESE